MYDGSDEILISLFYKIRCSILSSKAFVDISQIGPLIVVIILTVIVCMFVIPMSVMFRIRHRKSPALLLSEQKYSRSLRCNQRPVEIKACKCLNLSWDLYGMSMILIYIVH